MIPTCLINAVDLHAEGMQGRVVFGGTGLLDPPGDTMWEKMRFLEENRDWFRKFMLNEPRGGPTSFVTLVLPATHPDADVGVVILFNGGYGAISGTNLMCTVTALLETGYVPITGPVTEVTIDTPVGLVHARAECDAGKARRVSFENRPCFAAYVDAPIEVPGIGSMRVDVATGGGQFYVLADATPLGVALEPGAARELAVLGERIKQAAGEQLPVRLPGVEDSPNSSFHRIIGTALYGPAQDPSNDARHVSVVPAYAADAAEPQMWGSFLDRSPCGTATCARIAALHARGDLGVGDSFRNEGPLGTVFVGRVLAETTLDGKPAIVPEIGGRAWITALSQYVLDADDPFPEGFRFADVLPRAE